MAKNKYPSYDAAREFVRNKDKNVETYIKGMLSRTQEMFNYENLPESIPAEMLESILQKNGNAFITKVNGELYALSGNAGGELDAYNRPTIYTVANAALNISENYKIDVDGVLIKNDFSEMGLIPVLAKYAAMITDTEITVNMASIIMRIMFLISACDDKTKASADEFISKINNGDFSVIGDSAFFDGVRVQSATTANTNYIQQMTELLQYLKASAFNEIGLNANYNMKRERINESEIALNIDALIPLAGNMLSCRKRAIEKVNAMFDTDITVELSSVWRSTELELNDETEHADDMESISETDDENGEPEPTGGEPEPTATTPNRRAANPNRQATTPNRQPKQPTNPNPTKRATKPNRQATTPNRQTTTPTTRKRATMKINKIFSTDSGLFDALKETNENDFNLLFGETTTEIIGDYNLAFIACYGERTAAPLVNIIDKTGDALTAEQYKQIARIVWAKYGESWKRVHNALFAEYDAINPYKMETVTDDTTNGETSNNGTTNNASKVYGFDAGDAVNDSTDDTTTTGKTTVANTHNVKTTVTGNSGNRTPAELINSELQTRKTSFLQVVFSDLKNMLTISIYE